MSEKFDENKWRILAMNKPDELHSYVPQSSINELFDEIERLEKENFRLKEANEDVKSRLDDYRSDASRVLDEKCPSDERHCGCVPILRDQLNKYQKALILITTMPELSQAKIAREALQERGKFIWTEQSVGEYWVTKLDILQDQYDALEKDYADVCQKRLEAAEVWSRQIIELESENAELEAENERLQDAWFTDETICPDGSLKPKVSALLSRTTELEGLVDELIEAGESMSLAVECENQIEANAYYSWKELVKDWKERER